MALAVNRIGPVSPRPCCQRPHFELTTENRVKLANWNVAKPVSEVRRGAMLKYLGQVAADLVVLTEAHDVFNPGYKNVCPTLKNR